MSFFKELFKNTSETKVISGLTRDLKCIYAYNYFCQNEESILIVSNTLFEATTVYQIISSYTNDVLLFPMDDFLTSEALAISPELKNTRLETLKEIVFSNKKIVVTNLMGYLRYLPSKELYKNEIIKLKVGSDYSITELTTKLYRVGYNRETIVSTTGELAVRGFVIDIFNINSRNPIRIEFFGDTVESIRYFDVETQRTIENINEIEIYPNTEFLTGVANPEENKHYQLKNYVDVVNINDYVNSNSIFFDDYDQLKTSYELLLEEIFDYNLNTANGSNIKYMNDLYDIHVKNEIFLENFDNSHISVEDTVNYKTYEIEQFPISALEINKLLNSYLMSNKKVIICVENLYQANKIIDYLQNSNIVVTNEEQIFDNKINIIVKDIINGFLINDYVVISENEFFRRKTNNSKYKSNFKYGTKIRDINKLNIGDYIVHNIHGIGRYMGLKTLLKSGVKKDYLVIEYLGGDKLYIPVEKIELISKYSSNDSASPKINKLGTTDWEKTKLRIRKKLEDIAGQLLELYAKRESSNGFAFEKDSIDQLEFEKQFIYDETVDQLKVIEEIKKDMESDRPMDRLLCGDVGYGKTEVSFRAILKAVLSGKQVALLCPTTILSNQHYNNALDRFRNFPVNIAVLNRFVSTKEVSRVKKQLKEGLIDIVIGTHRLLSDDIEYKNLGLLVIDEEQRFGVKHKEKIKNYKNNIDVLTLSATPIPRTLQMSMVGIRNLSLIETPPVNRYPVQTYVLSENNAIIKDAIYKEISRDGQVFIIFNNITKMESKLSELNRLVPDAKIVLAHGRMTKHELEDVMMRFINKEFNVLLCTTIIETGIDIPNVNTLLIYDADNFGLSQLYQIRGRVGRSNKIAYCYLMYNKGKSLTEIATKRLNAIKEFTELGSGFAIAMRDLAIRGAGDILGSEQAGFIDTVGIELYLKMLEEEVKKLKGIEIPEEPSIDEKPLISVETFIDDHYVVEEDLKIEIHKKINEISSFETLDQVKQELEDRFGILSENILVYMHEELFECLAKKLGITKIRQTNNFIEITISKELTERLNGEYLFIESNKISKKFRFSVKNNCLIITLDIINLDKHFIYYLLDLIKIVDNSLK